jgi:carbamoyltransferase
MEKYYIGLACTLHDPAVAIVDCNGTVLFAEAAERYLQHKRCFGCPPDNATFIPQLLEKFCQSKAELEVATSWSKAYLNGLKFLSLLGLLNQPGKSLEPLAQRVTILKPHDVLWMSKLQLSTINQAGASIERYARANSSFHFKQTYYDHQLTHAANACYSSPFEEALCVIIEGRGEHGSISFYYYKDNKIKLIQRQTGPESLGFLYLLITDACGFDTSKGEEGKVMGLAPYGKFDRFIYEALKTFYEVKGCTLRAASFSRIRSSISAVYERARRKNASPLEAADLAYTGQLVYSEYVTQLLNNLSKLNISNNLILGGGCALNSAFNGSILRNTPFKQLHVPCAPGDDGNALGAAWLSYFTEHSHGAHTPDVLRPYLGSEVSRASLIRLSSQASIDIRHLPGKVEKAAASMLAKGKIVGWVQGRSEFGPRALGNRSILADPRSPHMKDKINSLVKFREAFRPFAPSILHEHGHEYFVDYQESPYMERALKYRKEVIAKIPAVVHCDGTGRLHTVKKEWNEKYYSLINAFYEQTGIPLLLNTSFNVMGKPLVHSVEDAVGVFYTTGLDALAIEDYLIEK